jgi:hypothetical protein
VEQHHWIEPAAAWRSHTEMMRWSRRRRSSGCTAGGASRRPCRWPTHTTAPPPPTARVCHRGSCESVIEWRRGINAREWDGHTPI